MSWREQTRNYEPVAYFVCLALMAISLTLSPFMMGASQFLLIFVWLFMGDPIAVKLERFLHNKMAWILISIYLLHVIGLTYTSDFAYAFKDLKIKLPLLVFPLVLCSVKPLEKRYSDLLLWLYVLSVFVATCISFYLYQRHQYNDVREISIFISHIRFCLNIVLVIGIVGYYLFTRATPQWERLLQIILIVWFCIQLYLFESLSGYVAFAGLIFTTLFYLCIIKIKNTPWKIVVLVILIGTPCVAGLCLYPKIHTMTLMQAVDLESLDKKTALGNDYWHDTLCFPMEDGKYVGLYFCRPEMREAWNRRSALDYDGNTLNGENLEATLARYLTSKDLRKDAEGVSALTDEDIHNVEQGVANYVNWKHPGVYSRLSQTLFEYNQYRRGNNPNGGSLSQRLEYTRAARYLIKQHPWFGVGTGDIPESFRQAYDELNSPLEPQYRHRAHNQYLTILVGFGFIGLVIFLFALLYPYCASKRYRSYLYTVFMVIMLISMFPEDTLETQAGVSLFALFNSLFIFALGNIDPKRKSS